MKSGHSFFSINLSDGKLETPRRYFFSMVGRFARYLLLAFAVLAVSMTSCSSPNSSTPEATSAPAEPRLIIAVSYPLEYLTQRIAGENFRVVCPVPEDQSAAEWKPQRADILKMQSSEMVVANGVGARFAKWLEMAAIPSRKICNSATKGLSLDDFIEVEDVVYTHSHGDLGEHSHPTNVAYTWLHPGMALKQAQFIYQDLARRFPEEKPGFDLRFQALEKDLQSLTQRFQQIPQPQDELLLVVLTANPELKFFSRAAGWDDFHLKWFEPPALDDAEAELKLKLETAEDRSLVQRSGKRLMLSTYPFEGDLALLAERFQLQVIVIEKLDLRPRQGDFLTVMAENIERLF